MNSLTTAQLVVVFFHETPNQAAAVAALVLLAIVSVAQTAATVKTRLWYMSVVAVTGFLEVAGFSTRLLMLSRPTLNLFVVHQGLLIISPVLLAVAQYTTAGRLLQLATGCAASSCSRGSRAYRCFVKSFFVASDVLCLLLQSTGGALYSQPGSAGMARALLLVGLGAQLVFFSAFICIVLHLRLAPRWGLQGAALRPAFACLFITAGLLHVRNIFRVVEFATGFDGFLATHELFFYVFDFVPVWLALVCFTVLHFGFWLGPAAPAAAALRAQAGAARLVGDPGAQQAGGAQQAAAAAAPALALGLVAAQKQQRSTSEAVVTISCDP